MKSLKNTVTTLCLIFGLGIMSSMAQTDKTGLITNPSFESGMNGWNMHLMKMQTNTSFTHKEGNIYVEKWVNRGSKAGDAHMKQTLKGVPPGRYALVVAAQNIQQENTEIQTGAWVVAGDAKLAVGASGDYTLEFTHLGGNLTIGFEAVGATGNYLSCDNFRLNLLDTELEALKEELQRRIEEVEAIVLGYTSPVGIELLNVAIEEARMQLASADAQHFAQAAASLKQALWTFRESNATGAVPSVVTHPFVARGATKAFGRIASVSGANLLEQGFCWSTQPDPTVADSRSTTYYTQNGRIYAMEDLEPSTIYYVRAYAMTQTYAVGYGDVVKVITLPKGNVTWGYDNGGDSASNVRINSAVADAVWFLNQLTSISGLYANVHWGAGTPTADCSYGGWMRVGPNASYQRTGTILHELGHAIGVGTHSVWNDGKSPLRAGSGRGDWLGERATAVVRFLNNDNSSVMTGDGTHMWPYGINGANEDNDDPILYMSNALIYQALGEDGLPPTSGFATPAYTFVQEDTVKYYIKNEDETYGLLTSYLVVENSKPVWKAMTREQVLADDHAAWYVTFNPENSYYQLCNAATGLYMAHGGATNSQLSGNTDFHLMRSRTDAFVGNSNGKVSVRGYWLVQPQKLLNPPCLTAMANGKVGTSAFNLEDAATDQRWVFMQAYELDKFEQAANGSFMSELDLWVERMEDMLAVPHTVSVEGTDEALRVVLDTLKKKQSQAVSATEIVTYVTMADEAIRAFLPNVTPTDVEKPFDITYMLTNASIDEVGGWSEEPTLNYSCMEYFESIFDFNQTLKKMPKGVYQLRVQAFQRAGTPAASYESYMNGNVIVTTEAYIGSKSQKVCHIATGAQENKLGGGEALVGDPLRYIPNDMLAASRYFASGLYENEVTMQQFFANKDITIGIRSTSMGSSFWTAFDNFRIYYYGGMKLSTVTAIDKCTSSDVVLCPLPGVYSITGVKVQESTSLDTLPAGIYIVNGRKLIWNGK